MSTPSSPRTLAEIQDVVATNRSKLSQGKPALAPLGSPHRASTVRVFFGYFRSRVGAEFNGLSPEEVGMYQRARSSFYEGGLIRIN